MSKSGATAVAVIGGVGVIALAGGLLIGLLKVKSERDAAVQALYNVNQQLQAIAQAAGGVSSVDVTGGNTP